MEETKVVSHMVQQIIKYSDGTETVINYKGVIENGVLIPDTEMEPEKTEEVVEATETVEETVEAPAEEVVAESTEEAG